MKTIFFKKIIGSIFWTAFISFFSLVMLNIIWPYTSWKLDIDFLLTKTTIIHLNYYRLSFYSHIFSSLIVLFCGAFLFSNYFLKKWPAMHRWIGKIYVALLLFVSAPSGFVMAFYANGGWPAKSSFLLLTSLWWWFTWKGYHAARTKKFKAHKVWMIRSYALTLSAISLRVYQMLLGHFSYLEPSLQYAIVSWVSWLGNYFLAELWIYTNNQYASLSFRAFVPKNFPVL